MKHPLQSTELLDVHGTLGAITRTVVEVSKGACTTVTTLQSNPIITRKQGQ